MIQKEISFQVLLKLQMNAQFSFLCAHICVF